jgi:hypothetical protein
MGIDEAQSKIHSREFVIWKEVLNEEPNWFNASHQYMAQIAAEIRDLRHMWAKGRHNPTTIEQMLLHFAAKDKRTEQRTLVDSKMFWLSGLGLTNELQKEGLA